MIWGRRQELLKRVARNSITFRIGSLSAVLLTALVVSTAIMTWELRQNLKLIAQSTERFHYLELAAEADRDFGEMRYWLTDLSVSLLTISERRAQVARERLDEKLTEVEQFAPEAAAQIRQGVENYANAALQAADAYTEDRRVIGNTLSARARQGSDAVDGALKKLISDLATEAATSEQAAANAARRSLAGRPAPSWPRRWTLRRRCR